MISVCINLFLLKLLTLFAIGFWKISISWYSFQQQKVVIIMNIIRLAWLSERCSMKRPKKITPIALVNLTNYTFGKSFPFIDIWLTMQTSISYWIEKLARNEMMKMTYCQYSFFFINFFSSILSSSFYFWSLYCWMRSWADFSIAPAESVLLLIWFYRSLWFGRKFRKLCRS